MYLFISTGYFTLDTNVQSLYIKFDSFTTIEALKLFIKNDFSENEKHWIFSCLFESYVCFLDLNARVKKWDNLYPYFTGLLVKESSASCTLQTPFECAIVFVLSRYSTIIDQAVLLFFLCCFDCLEFYFIFIVCQKFAICEV